MIMFLLTKCIIDADKFDTLELTNFAISKLFTEKAQKINLKATNKRFKKLKK